MVLPRDRAPLCLYPSASARPLSSRVPILQEACL
jgi:hypothetical protein